MVHMHSHSTLTPSTPEQPNTALIVIDLQDGFDDAAWGATNPGGTCRENCLALVRAFRAHGLPVVIVRHDSPKATSPLRPGHPGNRLDPDLPVQDADLLVTKTANSAFYGSPSLHTWLGDKGIHSIVVCGIQTNMCVETTARMAGNLGYVVTLPIDATRTFDLVGPTIDGQAWQLSADELLRASAVSLHGGGFATVTTTRAVIAALAPHAAPAQRRRDAPGPRWTTSHELTTPTPIGPIWEALVDIHRGELTLPGGDRFSPHGPLGVGMQVDVTPAGQDTMTSTITAFEPFVRYADRTLFGHLVLDFAHDLEEVGGGTRVRHSLAITGPDVDTLGPEIGPQISADFADQMCALVAAAQARHDPMPFGRQPRT